MLILLNSVWHFTVPFHLVAFVVVGPAVSFGGLGRGLLLCFQFGGGLLLSLALLFGRFQFDALQLVE